MTDLPIGWSHAVLGEVADTQLGKMLSKKSKTGIGSRPYLRNKNVQWGRFDLSDVAEMDFSDDEFEKFRLRDGDLLVCEGGEVGRTAIWREAVPDCAFQKALHRIRTRDGVTPEFIYYLLRHCGHSNAFERFVTGSTIRHLPQEDLRLLPVPLPPLLEQQRIVAAIEEQFSRLDAAEASLSRAGRGLSRMEAASFSALGATTWPVRPLREFLTEPLRNGHSAKAAPAGQDGVRTLTLTAVTARDFSVANTKVTVASPEKVRDLWLRPGDILIERSNTAELVGTAAMFEGDEDWAIFPDLMIRARVGGELLPAYLDLVLRTPEVRRYFRDRAQGIAGSMPKISQPTVEALPVPVPPLAVQSAYVSEAARLASLISSLRGSLSKAERRAAGLRSAVLRDAFVGHLLAGGSEQVVAEVVRL